MGDVLNVFTKEAHRKHGHARKLMSMLLEEAKAQKLDYVELDATDEGYPLYKSLGFEDTTSRYTHLKYTIEMQ